MVLMFHFACYAIIRQKSCEWEKCQEKQEKIKSGGYQIILGIQTGRRPSTKKRTVLGSLRFVMWWPEK
jgi:hypothetical protein